LIFPLPTQEFCSLLTITKGQSHRRAREVTSISDLKEDSGNMTLAENKIKKKA
jgi:hypothetical protein